MAKVKYSKVREWMKQEQGKHFCQCGCGKEIEIRYQHYYTRIPKSVDRHIQPHPKFIDKWIAAEQGKHICKCGCGNPIQVKQDHRSRGFPDYICGHQPSRVKSHDERIEEFWSMVNKTDDCWLWTGDVSGGYGRYFWDGRGRQVHRISYELRYKRPPENLYVCHHCDVKLCVRPDHLFLGTAADNSEDAMLKGLLARKMTKKQVLQLVSLVNGGMYAKYAAREVGISCSMAYAIMGGQVWSHVTGIKQKELIGG